MKIYFISQYDKDLKIGIVIMKSIIYETETPNKYPLFNKQTEKRKKNQTIYKTRNKKEFIEKAIIDLFLFFLNHNPKEYYDLSIIVESKKTYKILNKVFDSNNKEYNSIKNNKTIKSYYNILIAYPDDVKFKIHLGE